LKITRRKFGTGLAAAAAMGTLADCQKGHGQITRLSQLVQAANSGDLIVGVIPYYEMLTDEGSGRAPTGFMADLFGMFARAAGFSLERVQWRTISWASFGAMVRSGGVDFSIAGTFVTPERSAAVAFTRPLLYLGNGAVAHRGDSRLQGISSVHDLDRPDLKIAVVSGEQSAEYVRRNFSKAKILALSGSDLAAAPRAVENGSADVGMSDQFILSRYVSDLQHTGLEDILSGRPFSVLPIAWAVAHQAREAQLLAEINAQLDSVIHSNEFAALQARYPRIPFASPGI
jgi:polar amino acid transport system substrate-binding protein